MMQKLLFLAIGLLAGIAAFSLVSGKPKPAPGVVASEVATAGPEQSAPAPAVEHPAPAPPVKVAAPGFVTLAAPPVSAWTALSEKYGPEKTALSSKITSNLTSVIKDGMELANAAVRSSGSTSIAEAASKEILRNASGQLSLTETQQQQAATIIQSAVNKRVQAVEELTQAMSAEPEKMMEMMLAGDALARGQITQADYDNLTKATRTMLKNVTGFITGRPGADPGSQLLLDSNTMAQVNAILTPEQQGKLAEMISSATQKMEAREAARANRPGGPGFQPGEIPVMELGRLDQTVTSFKQMAEAGRIMLEAMKGLKEANPNPPPQ